MFPQLFVFDMIGTTVKPSGAIPEAFRAALAEAGIELTDEQIQSIRGKSKREAINELLAGSSEDGRRVYASFKARLEKHYRSGGAQPIDDAANTFGWCRSVGAKVALTTGFDRDIALLLIESLDWNSTADALVCNDDVPKGRPAPYLVQRAMKDASIRDSRDVAVVGDTVSDLQAGANAEVGWNFAVLTGAHPRDRLATVPGGIIIPGLSALRDFDYGG